MSQLKFRIILVPEVILSNHEKEEIFLLIKTTIESCGLTDASINFSQVKNSDDEDYSQLIECAFDVYAKTTPIYDGLQKVQQYEQFYFKWKERFSLSVCSYIDFFENDCFVDSIQSCHLLLCEGISFGVLPHNSQFFKFVDLTFDCVWINFYHDSRNVIIKCRNHDYCLFEITFIYDNIRNLFVSIEEKRYSIYFDLFNPPIIFRVDENNNKKYRTNCLFSMLHSYKSVNLFDVDADMLGRTNILSLNFENSDVVREIISCIHYQCGEKSVYYSYISPILRHKPDDPTINDMYFGCYYIMDAIFKRNFVAVSQASDIYSELKKLHNWCVLNPECLEKALISVLKVVDNGKLLNIWHAIKVQYKYFVRNKDEINFKHYIIPSDSVMIRKIIITPTRQILWPAEVMFGNRFLRNFDPEYSVYVSFREDDMTKLPNNTSDIDPKIFESCITDPLNNGICIGSRKYKFLAWSTSQLWDHGVWMYAKNEKRETATYIRNWMGDFAQINNIPKYMARLGQCFSTTEDAILLNPNFVKIEDDIKGGCNPVNDTPYIFSDGIGKISHALASKVHSALNHDTLCCAFEICYRGYKGVLVIDPTLEDDQIVFRKSMRKFSCNNSSILEIVKTSKPSPLRLNHSLIALLNGLGVWRTIFLHLQEDMLITLNDMMIDEEKAANFLKFNAPTYLYNYEDILKSGIHLTTEPFLKSFLLCLHKYHIERIKTKAYIDIDPSEGRNMLGVMDETDLLDYGEVFVQYSNDVSSGETTDDTTILTGAVLVTKKHCIHPGDIRKFNAVDIPALHHIVDCIVFPQRGRRPHPNEIAGSNLDGDEFVVIWHPDLIFKGQTQEAANVPTANSHTSDLIGISQMIHFLKEYVENDIVDLIANAHLIHADKDGILSKYFCSVAEKFLIAMDYAENGQIVPLELEEVPRKYPDFLENNQHAMYRSNNALGKMYRACKDFELEDEAISIKYENVQCDPDLIYPGWENFKDDAIKTRDKYICLFKCILRSYGIEHEVEALSGAFIKLHCRFQELKGRHEVDRTIIACIKKLHKCMHIEFHKELLNTSDIQALRTSIRQKASAWYVVTYSDPNIKFLSFPWIVSVYLANIKRKDKPSAVPPLFPPLIMNLDDKILECITNDLLPHCITSKTWFDYTILCNPVTLYYALRTIVFWAKEGNVVQKGGFVEKLCTFEDLVQIFVYVAEKFKYLIKKSDFTNQLLKSCSAGFLLLEFMKFCSAFRLYTPTELNDLLPFKLPEYSKLSRHAAASYHKFTVSGIFEVLSSDKSVEKRMIEMKPIYKNCEAFPSLELAECILRIQSKVHEISLREDPQTKKICISAKGNEHSIRDLKIILDETDEYLIAFILESAKPKSKKKNKNKNLAFISHFKSVPNSSKMPDDIIQKRKQYEGKKLPSVTQFKNMSNSLKVPIKAYKDRKKLTVVTKYKRTPPFLKMHSKGERERKTYREKKLASLTKFERRSNSHKISSKAEKERKRSRKLT